MQEININEPSHFSFVPLQVKITGPSQLNLVLLDMPGLITNARDQAAARFVEEIVALYARDPRFYIIVLTAFTASMDQQDSLAIIETNVMTKNFISPQVPGIPPRRPNWKKEALIVVNKFDFVHAMGIVTPDSLRTSMERYISEGPNVFVTALRPQRYWDGADITGCLQNPFEPEREFLRDYLETNHLLAAWTDAYSLKFGQDRIVERITKTWRDTLLHQSERIQRQLRKASEDTRTELAEITKTLGSMDSDSINDSCRTAILSYAKDFSDLIKTISSLPLPTGDKDIHRNFASNIERNIYLGHPQVASTNDYKIHHLNLLTCSTPESQNEYTQLLHKWEQYDHTKRDQYYGPRKLPFSTFVEELDFARNAWEDWPLFTQLADAQRSHSWDELVVFDESSFSCVRLEEVVDVIVRHFEGKSCQRALTERLKGYDSFKRIMLAFEYVLSSYDGRGVTDEEIRRIVDPSTGADNEARAVAFVRETMLNSIGKGCRTLCDTFRGLASHYADIAQACLIGDDADTNRPPKYRVLWQERILLNKIRTAFETSIDTALRTVYNTWTLTFEALRDQMEVDLPIRFLMGFLSTPLAHMIPLTPNEQQQLENPLLSTRETADIEPSQGIHTTASVISGDPENQREEGIRRLLRDTRINLQREFHRLTEGGERTAILGAVDAVAGGYMRPQQDLRRPNCEYIRSCGREQYYFAMFQLVNLSEVLFKQKFLALLQDPYTHLDLHQIIHDQTLELAGALFNDLRRNELRERKVTLEDKLLYLNRTMESFRELKPNR